jgi:hypothetical protein
MCRRTFFNTAKSRSRVDSRLQSQTAFQGIYSIFTAQNQLDERLGLLP